MQIANEGGLLIGASIGSEEIRLIACGLSGKRLGGLRLAPAKTVAAALKTLERGIGTLLTQLGRDMNVVRGIGVASMG